MQLVVGTSTLGVNQTLVQSGLETHWSAQGQPYEQKKWLDCQGYLLTTVPTGTPQQRQTDLTLLQSALRAALQAPNPDIKFLLDDGAVSADFLLNAGSKTGVRVTHLDFPKTVGPEYCTERTYHFRAEATYPLPGSANFALEFRESLSFGGGGPLYVVRPAINGPPQRQLVYPQTAYRARQRGYCVGHLAQLPPLPPRWPQALRQSGEFDYDGPDRPARGVYEKFRTSWSYEFESAGPLAGTNPALYQG
jgi:hypothetical protein